MERVYSKVVKSSLLRPVPPGLQSRELRENMPRRVTGNRMRRLASRLPQRFGAYVLLRPLGEGGSVQVHAKPPCDDSLRGATIAPLRRAARRPRWNWLPGASAHVDVVALTI